MDCIIIKNYDTNLTNPQKFIRFDICNSCYSFKYYNLKDIYCRITNYIFIASAANRPVFNAALIEPFNKLSPQINSVSEIFI